METLLHQAACLCTARYPLLILMVTGYRSQALWTQTKVLEINKRVGERATVPPTLLYHNTLIAIKLSHRHSRLINLSWIICVFWRWKADTFIASRVDPVCKIMSPFVLMSKGGLGLFQCISHKLNTLFFFYMNCGKTLKIVKDQWDQTSQRS